MSTQDFVDLLKADWPTLEAGARARVEEFYELVVAENEVQNLTRLISPQDFLDGHVRDVRELVMSGLVSFPAMDLGSGVGVPGLLMAAVFPGDWILSESEGHKASFLARSVEKLGLSGRVRVVPARGEAILANSRVESVVCRAVGKVEKVFGWLAQCSTWNNLVLLKGPAWSDEWMEFERSKWRGQLVVKGKHEYIVGRDRKQRIIVRLERVPRGTQRR